jgi:hypothetical protein
MLIARNQAITLLTRTCSPSTIANCYADGVDSHRITWDACCTMKRLVERWPWVFALGVGCAEPYDSLPSDVVGQRADAGVLSDGGFMAKDSGSGPDAGSNDSGGLLTVTDAATSTDGGDSNAADPTYCNGWTYCDMFEGTGNIPWRSESDGPLAKTEISPLRAKSGKFALRGYRTQATTNWAELVLRNVNITQCEYDVFVVNSPNAAAADTEVAYINLNGAAPGKYPPFPIEVYFDIDGIKLWEYHNSKNSVAPTFARQPFRDIWHHMTVELIQSNVGLIGSKASLAAGVQVAESRSHAFEAIPYTTVDFAVGLAYDTKGIADVEVYIDNVRCK